MLTWDQNLGEFESVDTTPSVTYVSFQDRKTAEKFYYSLHGKELPGVSGTLDLSWVNTPLPPAGSSSKKNEDAEDGDAMAGMNDDDGAVDAGSPGEHMREQRQVDMDYDVGEEEGEWVE